MSQDIFIKPLSFYLEENYRKRTGRIVFSGDLVLPPKKRKFIISTCQDCSLRDQNSPDLPLICDSLKLKSGSISAEIRVRENYLFSPNHFVGTLLKQNIPACQLFIENNQPIPQVRRLKK